MEMYARKEYDHIIELSNGNIIAIEKPMIEKNFCFGAGINGISTFEEEKTASDMAEYAKNSVNYFIEQNIKPLKDTIKNLELCLNNINYSCYTFVSYMGQPDTSCLMRFKVCHVAHNPENESYMWSALRTVKKLEPGDIKLIIKGYEEVIEKFNKRLNTYLKKYGLSKIQTWTYLVD